MGKEFDMEKLRGVDNFHNWSYVMKNFLALKGMENCIVHKPNTPASGSTAAVVHAADIAKETDATRLSGAKAYLVLAVESQIHMHIQECETALGIWNLLHRLFEDKGLSRKATLLGSLLSNKLAECDGVQDYVNRIKTAAIKLSSIGFPVNDEWLGAILLAGLTEDFKPFIMALEANGQQISGDMIMSKLMDASASSGSENTAFLGKYKGKKGKTFKKRRCYNCQSTQHLANTCDKPRKDAGDKKNNSAKAAFIMGLFTGKNKNEWYIDSGATSHMTPHRELLLENLNQGGDQVTSADGTKLPVSAKGETKVTFNDGSICVKNAMHVPNLAVNLLSISKITAQGNTVVFEKDYCKIFNAANECVVKCEQSDGVYKLKADTEKCFVANKKTSALTWHRRLGHVNYATMKKMRDGAVDGVDFYDDETSVKNCETCMKGKMAKSMFKASESKTNEVLDLIHSDLMGQMETASFGRAKYVLTFIDDFSRKTFVYFLRTKDETFELFQQFKGLVEKQTGKQIKRIRTDNGGEYISDGFEKFCKRNGILHEKTTPYTPEQNGTAERMNRTLVEKAKCLLFENDMDKRFWAEAINMATYLVNRTPCTHLKNSEMKTPEEVFTNKKSDLSDLKLFGSKIMVMTPKQRRRKWDANAVEMIFVGYECGVKGYRCFDTKTNKITMSRNVRFLEDTNAKKISLDLCDEPKNEVENEKNEIENEINNDMNESIGSVVNEEELNESEITLTTDDVQTGDASVTVSDESANETVYESSNETLTDDDPTYRTRAKTDGSVRSSSRLKKPFQPYRAQFAFLVEPASRKEAINSERREEWQSAMEDEIKSHEKNNTWTLVELPKDRKAITAKWVFKLKSAGTVNERHKARLVARGYSQIQGIDYTETFCPVVRHTSLRILFALATQLDWHIHQMDAVTAFLQGDLQESLYMCQPDGYDDNSGRVCKLNKAIYGLKQAGRTWNQKLDKILLKFGLTKSKCDPCVYFNREWNLVIAVYVDDFLIFYKESKHLNNIRLHLNTSLHMKDVGEAKECIGIQITKTDGKIELSQEMYVEQMLRKFNMEQAKATKTPADPNEKLSVAMWSEENDAKGVPYQEVVGSLLYAAQITRPDISFAVNNVSRFNVQHAKEHWNAVQRILRYLIGTKDFKLRFEKGKSIEIEAYSDADYASDIDKRRSCTGYVIKIAGAAVSWHSKRQEVVALSSTEAEYIALSTTAKEVVWVSQFVCEISGVNVQPVKIWCDNTSTIKLAKSDAYRERTKHIDVRFHQIRDWIQQGKIGVC
jgi:transposase InsO family protein